MSQSEIHYRALVEFARPGETPLPRDYEQTSFFRQFLRSLGEGDRSREEAERSALDRTRGLANMSGEQALPHRGGVAGRLTITHPPAYPPIGLPDLPAITTTGAPTTTSTTVQPTMAPTKPASSQQPRPRFCIICTEEFSDAKDDPAAIRPCRSCSSDWCRDCVEDMFIAATRDVERMPPRCCTLFQVNTVQLSDEHLQAYRAKFKEWITVEKVYCPVPTCSVFIPEQYLPTKAVLLEKPKIRTSKMIMMDVVKKVMATPAARFFRTNEQQNLPNYKEKVKVPISLTTIQQLATSDSYQPTSFVKDIRLIVDNAEAYNGSNHPVTQAAKELQDAVSCELIELADGNVNAAPGSPPKQDFFACPSCHIAVCTECRQVEHTGKPCDTTTKDEEIAMLSSFGYKRCPRCGHGYKKMFGCSHMRCHCGAHFCHHCEKSIELCTGGCVDVPSESEDYDDSDDDEAMDALDRSVAEARRRLADAPAPSPGGPPRRNTGAMIDEADRRTLEGEKVPDVAAAQFPSTLANEDMQTQGSLRATQLPVNLDAGGARRWVDTELDFGEEPDDEGVVQVWSCKHKFEHFKPKEDGYFHGDLFRMECNRCFTHVGPAPPAKQHRLRGKRRKLTKTTSGLTEGDNDTFVAANEEEVAWECVHCYLVACVGCKDRYKAEHEKK